MEEYMRKYLFKWKLTGLTIVWIIISTILITFLLLWNYNKIPLLPNLDLIIFSYAHIFLFGIIINTFSQLIIAITILLAIKTFLTSCHGLIGTSLQYSYKIITTAFICIPLGFLKLGIEIEDMAIFNIGLSMLWIFIVIIIVYAFQFVFEILSILKGEKDDFYLSEKENKKIQKVKSKISENPILDFEIFQVRKDHENKFIPSGNIKLNGIYIFKDNTLINAKITNKLKKQTNLPRTEKKDEGTIYFFD